MSREKTSYNLLIEKLDQFIRKFYINNLIKGTLYSIGLIVLCFLVFAIAEYFFYFSTTVRKALLFSFIGVSSVSLFYWVILPIIHYFQLGQIISHEKAAEIIGNHFTGVKDKLVNVLQLNKQLDETASKSLILASIDQKTTDLAPVSFQSAIDLTKNRRYLPYALPPLMLLLGLVIGAPSLIKDPTNRILRNGVVFEKDAPFYFNLSNTSLEVPQYEDYNLSVSVEGDFLPENAFVVVNGFQYRMKKEGPSQFSYVFNNVQKDQSFSFLAEKITSKDYDLKVLKKPNIVDFATSLDYPGYLGRRDEELSNIGDLVIPEGTKVDWVLQSVNTDQVFYRFGADTLNSAQRLDQDAFTFNKRVYRNTSYKLLIGNENLPNSDSIAYSISVIPDLHPTIDLTQFIDSSDQKLIYLVGDAADDYGLKSLSFNYQITNKTKAPGTLTSIPIKEEMAKTTTFDHVFDINTLQLSPGDEVQYYFEVWDNDGVNGSKSTRTAMLHFLQPTAAEFREKENSNEEEIKNTLDKSMKESKDIKKDFKALREKMLQEKSIDWQLKKELQELLDRQNDLQKEIDSAKEKFEENRENQKEFEETPPEVREKQEKLSELFEELADQETKELMEKIQKLMEELKKDEALQMMEEMEFSEEELAMELERLKELFKQLELERDISQELEKLKELAEEQKELAEETAKQEESKEEKEAADSKEEQEKSDQKAEDKKTEEEASDKKEESSAQDKKAEKKKDLEEKQKEINEAFKEIKEELEELDKKNEELEAPKELGDHKEQSEDIEEDLEQSLDQLQQKQNKDASKSQQNAGEKMEQMAQKMQEQMESGEMQQMAEDMKAMRQLLENLIGLSFDQEELVNNFSKTHTSTPQYTGLIQQQHKLEADFHLIEDSLQALSQRVYQIESFVLEKVSEINGQMDKSLKLLEDRKKAQASDNQHRVMKNVNDLALMFNESMQKMQEQMAQKMAGAQMCTKPNGGSPKDGKGGPPMDKITEGQKGLNGEMKKMQEGSSKGESEGGSSKEFAQMAAKQAALRKALQDVQNEKQAQGKGSKELQEILEQMDKIETDLVNKRLTNEMLLRQEDILTRLLESEKAEREREYENKRESQTGKSQERALPPSVEEYLKERESQIEPFKTVSPALKPYYKQLVEEYYKSLKEN